MWSSFIRPLQRRHTESRSHCVLVQCTDQTSKVLQIQQVAAVKREIACAGAVESCRTIFVFQYLCPGAGELGPIEGQRLFSAAPALLPVSRSPLAAPSPTMETAPSMPGRRSAGS